MIQVRNEYVLERVSDGKKRVLDLGCGTGELARTLAQMGHEVTGVDFAAPMVEKAREIVGESAQIMEASVLDLTFPDGAFDVIVANGLIEYFSRSEVETLSQNISKWLGPRGKLLLHSRNRLFNLFSRNKYTEVEEQLGTLADLHNEVQGKGGRTSYPPFSEHPVQEIGVRWRHQYTPKEIQAILKQVGLRQTHFQPCHFHAFPPDFIVRYPALHHAIAVDVQPLLETHPELLSQCSSFLVEAVRES